MGYGLFWLKVNLCYLEHVVYRTSRECQEEACDFRPAMGFKATLVIHIYYMVRQKLFPVLTTLTSHIYIYICTVHNVEYIYIYIRNPVSLRSSYFNNEALKELEPSMGHQIRKAAWRFNIVVWG